MRCATLVSIFGSCNWLGHHYNTQFLKQNFRLITGLVRLAPFLFVSFLFCFPNSCSLVFDQVSVSGYSFISYYMTADFVCTIKFAFVEIIHCLHCNSLHLFLFMLTPHQYIVSDSPAATKNWMQSSISQILVEFRLKISYNSFVFEQKSLNICMYESRGHASCLTMVNFSAQYLILLFHAYWRWPFSVYVAASKLHIWDGELKLHKYV